MNKPTLDAANAVRSSLAADKRRLKAGDMPFEEAALSDRWRNRSALELIGYAVIPAYATRRWQGRRTPQPCGRSALTIAAACGVDHFTVVAELTPDQVSRIGRTIRQTSATFPASSDPRPSASASS